MSFLRKIFMRSLNAQVSLEYMAIIGMVIIGVIAGGPYIVRAVNSYFHNVEDGIEDSLRERTGEVPIYEMPDCVCEEQEGNCGVADCTVENATANVCCYRQKDFAYLNCTPPSCQHRAPHCVFHSDCCERYAEACGAGASIPLTATCSGCIVESGHLSCPDGERLYRFECGDVSNGTNEIHYECSPDTDCIFQCIGTKDNIAIWCLGSDYNTRMVSNLNTVHVLGASGCALYNSRVPPQKCVAYLPCPDGTIWVPDSCPANTCEQYTCSAGYCSDVGTAP